MKNNFISLLNASKYIETEALQNIQNKTTRVNITPFVILRNYKTPW